MVVEKITAADGNLAPTLVQHIAKNGFTNRLRVMIDELEYIIMEQRIDCSDLTCANVVVCENRLVIIDGTSNRSLINFNRYSVSLFLRSCTKRFSRLRGEALGYAQC